MYLMDFKAIGHLTQTRVCAVRCGDSGIAWFFFSASKIIYARTFTCTPITSLSRPTLLSGESGNIYKHGTPVSRILRQRCCLHDHASDSHLTRMHILACVVRAQPRDIACTHVSCHVRGCCLRHTGDGRCDGRRNRPWVSARYCCWRSNAVKDVYATTCRCTYPHPAALFACNWKEQLCCAFQHDACTHTRTHANTHARTHAHIHMHLRAHLIIRLSRPLCACLAQEKRCKHICIFALHTSLIQWLFSGLADLSLLLLWVLFAGAWSYPLRSDQHRSDPGGRCSCGSRRV